MCPKAKKKMKRPPGLLGTTTRQGRARAFSTASTSSSSSSSSETRTTTGAAAVSAAAGGKGYHVPIVSRLVVPLGNRGGFVGLGADSNFEVKKTRLQRFVDFVSNYELQLPRKELSSTSTTTSSPSSTSTTSLSSTFTTTSSPSSTSTSSSTAATCYNYEDLDKIFIVHHDIDLDI